MTASTAPPNPCIRNCCLDHNDVCMGCLRTLKEILDWHSYTDAQKRELIQALELRKAQRASNK